MKYSKRGLCIFLVTVFMILSLGLTSFAEGSGSITLRFVSNKGIDVSAIGVVLEGKLMGTTDANGNLFISPISIGHHDITISTKDNRIDGVVVGFYVTRENDSTQIFIDVCIRPGSEATYQQPQQEIKTPVEKIVLEPLAMGSRNTSVAVDFDSTIPIGAQEYINRLIKDIDPVIKRVMGMPIQNSKFALTYDPNQHVGFRNNKTVLLMNRLPTVDLGVDSGWDDWFTINYIHLYLDGRNTPIPGSRYSENLAHPIKTIVLNYMNQEGIRKSNQKSIDYYVNAYDTFESLGPNILLNQGNTDNISTGFNPNDFQWESISYERVNAFTLEYAKSLWLKLYRERAKETGKNDFFVSLQNAMYERNPQTPEEFYGLMDGILSNMNGLRGGEWIKKTSSFAGKIEEVLTVRAFVVKGDYWNVLGTNDPNVIYPFIVSRTPGKVLSEDVQIKLLNSQNSEIFSRTIKSGFNENGIPYGAEVPKDLKPGKYTALIRYVQNGTEFISTKSFSVTEAIANGSTSNASSYLLKLPELKPIQRNTKVSIIYDVSIPQEVRDYINKLISDIDPVIRGFVGDPIENQSFTFKCDPYGLQGMNGNMTVLNTQMLPQVATGKPDTGFDSFFFIEYYHLFHRGRSVPIEELRYSENISQAMKIVIGNYLNQNNIRRTTIESIPYYLNLYGVLNGLGPGILVNNGMSNGNPGGTDKLKNQWNGNSKYEMLMNVFTLNYSLTLWLKLADAEYKSTGQYDFFMRLQDALYTSQPNTPEDFYRLIDNIIKNDIEGKKPSDWLRNTGLLKPMGNENTFVAPLAVRGNWYSMNGTDDPDYIFPFVVDRSVDAKILDNPVKISITDVSGKEIYSEPFTPSMTQNGEYMGIKVPKEKLSIGDYYAVVTATVNGKDTIGKQAFKVIKGNSKEVTPSVESKSNDGGKNTGSDTKTGDAQAITTTPSGIQVTAPPTFDPPQGSTSNDQGSTNTKLAVNNDITKSVQKPQKLMTIKSSITLPKGQKEKLPVIRLLKDGKQTDITNKVKWTMKNSKIATVKGGFVQAISKGNTSLMAVYSGMTVTITVIVK